VRHISFESAPASTKAAKYKACQRVKSEKFGEGIILESKLESDGEEIIDVHFKDYGLKHLMASLANLEILQ
jgi:hypothetical protein